MKGNYVPFRATHPKRADMKGTLTPLVQVGVPFI